MRPKPPNGDIPSDAEHRAQWKMIDWLVIEVRELRIDQSRWRLGFLAMQASFFAAIVGLLVALMVMQ